MRIRNNPKAKEIIAAHKYVESLPKDHKDKWQVVFGNANPICLEIGMGKGDFIIGMAKLHPNINWIAIERFPTIILKALKKIDAEGLTNIVVIDIDAAELGDVFGDGEINNIYLNFSDPWPKSKHDKRRLTHRNKLDIYEKIINTDGKLIFKTDNQKLFEWSLESFSKYGMILENISLNLHETDWHNSGSNVVTEYETKFSNLGFRINRVEAKFSKKGNVNDEVK